MEKIKRKFFVIYFLSVWSAVIIDFVIDALTHNDTLAYSLAFFTTLIISISSVTYFKTRFLDPLHELWQVLVQLRNWESGIQDEKFETVDQIKDLLGEIFISLMDKNKRINDESKIRSEFFANMSHEIRTPMNAIIGLTDIAVYHNRDEKIDEFLQKIIRSSKTLLQIIDDILDFSKLHEGKMQLKIKEFNLCELIEHVAYMFSEKMREKPIEFITSIDTCGLILNGDSTRIEQVLFNLIGNAFKFTDEGEIELKVKTVREGDNIQVTFIVSDTGIGIDSHKLDMLFEPFHQVDESLTRKFGGTGLGLTISNMFVKLMGSEIKVTSERFKGSEFKFTVCLKYVKQLEGNKLGLKILVVEQNRKLRECICSILEYLNCEVYEASNIESAIFNTRFFKYDLIIVNYTINSKISDLIQNNKTLLMINPYYSCDIQGIKRIYKPVYKSNLVSAISDVMNFNKKQLNDEDVLDLLTGTKILAVEDNHINQQVIVELLKTIGVDVHLAVNGRDALDKYDESFDCILMDIQMPVMDGYTATGILKDKKIKTPIIAMTAHTREEDIQKSLKVGMIDHLTKPIRRKELYRSLLKHLKNEDGEIVTSDFKSPFKFNYIESSTPLSQLNGNIDVYKEMLKSFVSEFEKFIDCELDDKQLHSIKGAASNIGAMNLASMCETSSCVNNELIMVIEEIKREVDVNSELNVMFEKQDIYGISKFCTTREQIDYIEMFNVTNDVNFIKDLKITFNL
jgi:two-component system sensor histidine kinase/response regulator